MAYPKRYPGGFVDLPTKTTPVDQQFLNAVETSLLRLDAIDPSADGQVVQWIAASSKYGPALILNKNIDPAAAIDKSKLNLAGQITNADVAGSAAIARSKLDFGAGLVNADIAAAAGIVASKLAGYPSDGSKVLKGDGSWAAPAPYRKTTAKAVNTTVSPTDLLNGEISIAAGAMGATGMLRLTAFGDWLQNSGAGAVAPRWQLVFGGTTVFDTSAGPTCANSATRGSWKIVVEIFNTAANAQVCYFHLEGNAGGTVTSGDAAFTTGQGRYGGNFGAGGTNMLLGMGYNTGALDTSTAKTLVLNTINGSASGSYETKLASALVEIL